MFSFVCIFEAHTLSRIRDVYIYVVVYVVSSGFAVFSTLLLHLIVDYVYMEILIVSGLVATISTMATNNHQPG